MTPLSRAVRKPAIRSAWKDIQKFTTLFLFAATCLASYHAIRFRFGDWRTVYTYHSTEGPFHTTLNDDETRVMGDLAITAIAGETIGWYTTACVAPGVKFRGVAQLRRKYPLPEVDAMPSREIVFLPADTHCGRRSVFLMLDRTLADGLYETTRTVHLREDSWWPLMLVLPPVPIAIRQPPAQN